MILLAFLLDLLIGDPPFLYHPVRAIGSLVRRLENFLRLFAKSKVSEKIAGIGLVVIVSLITYGFVWALLEIAGYFSSTFKLLLEAWLISTTIAVKGLAQEAKKVVNYLRERNLPFARKQVGTLVSRDTLHLGEEEIVRATVETVAENIVDAVISPLFFAIFGGAPLAFLYRAANTMDSMVGYKNERYFYFGWAAARFDDLLNYIPARITGFLLVIVSFLLRLNYHGAWLIWKRDAKKHPSPNSGIPEGTVAGALNIRLGGVNYYFGEAKFRPFLGEPIEQLNYEKINEAIRILFWVSSLFVSFYGIGVVIWFMINR